MGVRCKKCVVLRAEKDRARKEGEGGDSKWRIPLLEDNVRHVTGCLIILGEDASVRVTNSGKVMVDSGKGDLEYMIKDIKEQISSLKKEACKAKAKPVRVGSDQPTNQERCS